MARARGYDRGRLTDAAFSSALARSDRAVYRDKSGRFARAPERGGSIELFSRGRRHTVIRLKERVPLKSERLSLSLLGRKPEPKGKALQVEKTTWLSQDLKRAGLNRIKAPVVSIEVTGRSRGRSWRISIPSVATGRDKVAAVRAAVAKELALRGLSASKKPYRFPHQSRYTTLSNMKVKVSY